MKRIFIAVAISLLFQIPGYVAHGAGKIDFMLGISQGAPEAVPVMKELGIKWGRTSISIKEVMPELVPPLITLAEAKSDPGLVDKFIREANWSVADQKIRLRLDNGITPIVLVGSGWHNSYTIFKGKEAWPDRIGRDHYLAYMYLYVRAVVERYDGDGYLDAPGIVIKIWQTENELNQAGLTAGWGWRKPAWFSGLNSAWADWEFLTKLLDTLNQAVHDADREAMTCMNFHTDIQPGLNRLFHTPDWEQSLKDWHDLMDIVAFDAYPNYYSADPLCADVIGDRVRTIKNIVGDKPVIIMEVDYPYGPSKRNFTPEKQALFLRQSYDSARAAGVEGYFKFRVVDPDQKIKTITEKDLLNIDKIIPWWEEGRVWRLLLWAIPRAGYVQNHFLDVMKSVEGHWGVIDQDGHKMPAYYVLEEIVNEH